MSGLHSTIATAEWPSGRVGYVCLLGRPNAGKSTLLNTLLAFHLAPVSAKPQTTRRNLLGILTDGASQLLLLDAPGVHRPLDELDAAMARAVATAVEEADVVLCLADPTRPPGDEDALVAAQAAAAGKPVVLALNKCDAARPQDVEAMAAFYRLQLPAAPLVRICAHNPATLKPLLEALRGLLPEGPFFYPPDQVTASSERELAADLIREACLELLRQEVPHAMAAVIEQWQEQPALVVVHAALHVEREAQKRIVIGSAGSMIGKVRRAAQKRLAEFCGRPVRLHLHVCVTPDWRSRVQELRGLNLT